MNASPSCSTFLFTDIEGSTSMWEERPEEMLRATALHDGRLTAAIQSRRGRVRIRSRGVRSHLRRRAAPGRGHRRCSELPCRKIADDSRRYGAWARYRLLETIRDYAREKLADRGALSTFLTAPCNQYLTLAKAANR